MDNIPGKPGLFEGKHQDTVENCDYSVQIIVTIERLPFVTIQHCEHSIQTYSTENTYSRIFIANFLLETLMVYCMLVS